MLSGDRHSIRHYADDVAISRFVPFHSYFFELKEHYNFLTYGLYLRSGKRNIDRAEKMDDTREG